MVRGFLGAVVASGLVVVVVGGRAGADEPPRPGDVPPHQGEGGTMRRGDEVPPPPVSPPAPAPVTPPPGYQPPAPMIPAKVLTNKVGGGFGAGMWMLTLERVDDSVWETVNLPAIVITGRRVKSISPRLGYETVGSIVVQDFETIGDWYQWYGEEPDNSDGSMDKDYRVLKYFILWPGLLLGPFAGSNIMMGSGLTGYLSEDYPALYLSGGIHTGFYLRPSEDDLVFDFTAGFYSAFGVDFSPTTGLDLRGYWGPPIFHALGDRPETNNFTVSLSFMIYKK